MVSIKLTTAAFLTVAVLAGPGMVRAASAPEMPVAEFLQALAGIAPPAQLAAKFFLEAHQAHCGRTLTVKQLRQAFAEGDGDPVLMKMVGAAARDDTRELGRLGASITCRPAS